LEMKNTTENKIVMITIAPDNDCQPTSKVINTIVAGTSIRNIKQHCILRVSFSILCASFDTKLIMWPAVTLERLPRFETRIYGMKHGNNSLRFTA
jgi:hypothetical protein